MKRGSSDAILSAVFVDYDNIYLSLKRKNEEAAKRFAKDAGRWLAALQSGELITHNLPGGKDLNRRLVMNRCYGNPVPRRNQSDNSTDMNSFPFVRHHFLRNGFEITDCPPLTAQLKNSSDIKMVMDLRDFLTHETYFDEFVILSSDADFTPVLHRLRAHNRRTVIFSNDNTAAPYTAIADGEVRESDLIALLVGEEKTGVDREPRVSIKDGTNDNPREQIVTIIAQAVREAPAPLPLEAAAERATRTLGHERTIGTNWGGAGSFLELLKTTLPDDIGLSDQTPPVLYDQNRVVNRKPARLTAPAEQPAPQTQDTAVTSLAQPSLQPETHHQPAQHQAGLDAAVPPDTAFAAAHDRFEVRGDALPPLRKDPEPQTPDAAAQVQARPGPNVPGSSAPGQTAPAPRTAAPRAPHPTDPHPTDPHPTDPHPTDPGPSAPATSAPSPSAREPVHGAAEIQKSIARIHEASQAPPLSPPDYRVLFEEMSAEISENQLQGVQTISNVEARTQRRGVAIRREDIRFVLDVVGEPDPWFEQGASANLFAGRFRNFVVARCRGQDLSLSSDELDLIETWFANAASAATGQNTRPDAEPAPATTTNTADTGSISYGHSGGDDMPRIVRAQARI